MSGYAPRAREDSVRPRRLIGASGRPLNFTVRRLHERTSSYDAASKPSASSRLCSALLARIRIRRRRSTFHPHEGLESSHRGHFVADPLDRAVLCVALWSSAPSQVGVVGHRHPWSNRLCVCTDVGRDPSSARKRSSILVAIHPDCGFSSRIAASFGSTLVSTRCSRLTIVGGVRERSVVTRRGRAKTVCARVA